MEHVKSTLNPALSVVVNVRGPQLSELEAMRLVNMAVPSWLVDDKPTVARTSDDEIEPFFVVTVSDRLAKRLGVLPAALFGVQRDLVGLAVVERASGQMAFVHCEDVAVIAAGRADPGSVAMKLLAMYVDRRGK